MAPPARSEGPVLACDGRAVGVTDQLHQAWCQQLTAGLHSMGVRERVQSWGYPARLDALLSSQLEVGEPVWMTSLLTSLGALAMSAGVGLGRGGTDRPQSQWGLLSKVEGL